MPPKTVVRFTPTKNTHYRLEEWKRGTHGLNTVTKWLTGGDEIWIVSEKLPNYVIYAKKTA